MKLSLGFRSLAASILFACGLGAQGIANAQSCTPTLNTSIGTATTLTSGVAGIGCSTVSPGDWGTQWFFNVPTGTTSVLLQLEQLSSSFRGVFELWNYNSYNPGQFQLLQGSPVALTVPPDAAGSGLLFTGDFSGLYKVWAGPITGGDGPFQISGSYEFSVTAVPEPHEWAMMLAGLGLVVWMARRRRSDVAPVAAVA
jgi:hypothetical protein